MNRKPLRKKTPFRLLLLVVILTPFLIPGGATQTAKADSIGQCGDPYEYRSCWGWDGWLLWCGQPQACVNCDGGTYCYPMN